MKGITGVGLLTLVAALALVWPAAAPAADTFIAPTRSEASILDAYGGTLAWTDRRDGKPNLIKHARGVTEDTGVRRMSAVDLGPGRRGGVVAVSPAGLYDFKTRSLRKLPFRAWSWVATWKGAYAFDKWIPRGQVFLPWLYLKLPGRKPRALRRFKSEREDIMDIALRGRKMAYVIQRYVEGDVPLRDVDALHLFRFDRRGRGKSCLLRRAVRRRTKDAPSERPETGRFLYEPEFDGRFVYWKERSVKTGVAHVARARARCGAKRQRSDRTFSGPIDLAVDRGKFYYAADSGIYRMDDPKPRFAKP